METKLAENSSLVPLGRITSIQFSLATPDEIVKASNSEPIQQPSQLSGPFLGLPTESNKCSMCGTFKFDECEGHFGHICLPTAVYHPSHMQEVVRILGRICLNCFKLKKKKIMNSMKEILQEKKLTNHVIESDGMKRNNSKYYKRKDFCDARHSPIASDTSANFEEDPLLRSLIPTRLRYPSKIKKSDKYESKNFKFIKEMANAGMQQTKQTAVLGKRKVTSCMPDLEYHQQEKTCKYCKDTDNQSAKSHPDIKVKIVLADNGKAKVIQMSSHKEVPPKFWNFVDIYSGSCSENKSSRTLLPFEALNILRQIPETTSKVFGISLEGLIWESLPVPPNCTRISGVSFRTTRVGTDGATQMLKKVINTVGKIRESRGAKPTMDTIKHESKVLQSLCTEYLEAQGGSKVIRDKETAEFYGHNNAKTKSFTKLWGERIEALLKKTSGFSARGIITGDAYRAIDQIGIPLKVANSVTVEEHITVHNKEKMQNIVNQGLYTLLVDRGGNRRSKEFLQTEKVVEIGEIVHRQVADGDIVFVNRPPSIHKHSFLALKACIQSSCNFSISPIICPPLDADFDGDCIHVFVPQTLQSRAELSQLLTLDQQLIDSQGGQMLLMLTQDTLLSASLILSMPFLNQMTMHQLSLWTSSAVPKPAIIKSPHGGPYWTGCQLFQMCLPSDIYCIGNGLLVHKGELLSIHHGAKQLRSSIELILHTLILKNGPSEALKFLNSSQHCLTEWLSQQGLSVGLDDVHPFHKPSHKKDLIETIKKCIADATPHLKHETVPCFEDTIVPYLQDRVSEAFNKVMKHFSRSNSLLAIVDAGSGGSMNKVAQQTGFLGLQIFKGKELIPREWSNRIFSALKVNTHFSYDVNVCESRGLIVSSIANGLKPHEAFINAVSSRETLFCKAIEVKEPGTLFKKLMSFLRDIVISYDGTCRTTQGKHLVQFKYDYNVCPKDSGTQKLSSEWQGENTEVKIQLQPGEPVGVLAATAIANPSYKILLDAVQRNISSWYLLKDTLFHGLGSRLKLSDQTVILRLQSCFCSGTYCLEKASLQIKRHLQKVPLKIFSVSIKVGYWDANTMEGFGGLIESPFVGHVQLDEGLLKEENLSIDSLLLNLKKSIRSQRNPLYHLSDRLILWISEKCSGAESSKVMDIQIPCLHFCLETSDDSIANEEMVDILVNVICPKLLETTAKGDDRIQSVKVSWSPVDSASWVPLQIGSHQSFEGEIIIEATIEKGEVKQCGNGWKIIHDACLPLMGSLNTNRCIPYSINEIYKYFGISAAYYLLLQRLSRSITSIGSHVYKEHLILISNYMCCSGKIIGLTAGGYRHFLQSFGMSAPFAEASMRMPLKCFEKAAERGQEDTLSSTIAACSWGQCPLLGTGGEFEVLWNNKEATSYLSDQLCKHGDVYEFLENMGIIPCGKEETSSEFHLDENLCDGIDDTSEFMASGVIFIDSPMEEGANFNDKDSVALCDISVKSANQIDGKAKTSSLSGWEASMVMESPADGWGQSVQENKEISDRKTGSQSKVASGWDTNSTLVDDSTNATVIDKSVKSANQINGKAKTSSLSGWEASMVYELQADGWGQSVHENKETSDKKTGSQSNVASGWDTNSTLVDDSTNATVIDGRGSGWTPNVHCPGKRDSKTCSPEDTITYLQCQNLRSEVIGEINSTGAWENHEICSTRKDHIGNHMSEPQNKSTWESSWQESEVEDVSGWKSNVETAGGKFKHEKKQQGESNWQEDEVRNASCWNSNLEPSVDGWTKNDNSGKSQEDSWKCKDERSTWEVDLRETDVTNGLDWNAYVETAGESNVTNDSARNTDVETAGKSYCTDGWQSDMISTGSKVKNWKTTSNSKKRAIGTDWTEFKTSNWSVWESTKDNRDKKDSTDLHNPSSKRIHQQEITGGHDNQQNHNKSSRFQKCITFQRKGNKAMKNVEGNNNMRHHFRQKEIALQATEDPDFPPGFSVVRDSYSETIVSSQQIENDSTDISKSSRWRNSKDEQGQHESSFSGDIRSDNTLKFKRTGANEIPLGKRSYSRIQWEAQSKNTTQSAYWDQRISEEVQANGWNVDWQAIRKTSRSTPETRVEEEQANEWSVDQKISEEARATGWSVDKKISEEERTTGWTVDQKLSEVAQASGWSAEQKLSEGAEATGWNAGQKISEGAEATGWTAGQKISKEAKATGWSIDQKISKEAQSTGWSEDQIISKEAQATGWNAGWQAGVLKTTWTTPEIRVERSGRDRPLEKNVFKREQVDHDNSRRPLSADNLSSPAWAELSTGDTGEQKVSSSGKSHKLKPTGANVVPLGTRSERRAQTKAYQKNSIEEHLQDQALSKVTQPMEWGITCHVEEDMCESWTARQPDEKCKYSKGITRKVENSTTNKDCHTPRISEEDTFNSNLERNKNVVMTVTEHDSDGWNRSPETRVVKTSLKGCNNDQLVCDNDPSTSVWESPNQSDSPTSSGWELPNQSDPPTSSGWNLPNQSDPPTTSGRELPNQSLERPTEKLCTMKRMEDVEPSNDRSSISSLRSIKRAKVYLEHKNLGTRNYTTCPRNSESLRERVNDRLPKLQELLHEINPLMYSMRRILHYSSYNSGDRLRPEDEREVLEKVLFHHPQAEAKMGCGIDFITVDNHTEFSSTRCFYIVRKDGTKTDFSYLKCLKGLVEKKFPDSANDFIEKYLNQRK